MPEYIIRRTEKNDYEAIKDAYNRFTGRSKTMAEHLWAWVDTPFDKNESWVIENTSSHEVVGHHGVMCLPFTQHGRPISVGKTENTFVLREHAKNFFYPTFEKKALNNMKHRFHYIYTADSGADRGAVGILRKRLGYSHMGKIACFSLYGTPSSIKKLISIRVPSLHFLAGLLALSYNSLLRTVQASSYLRARKVQITPLTWDCVDEIGEFWRNCSKSYEVTVDRNAAYLKWRFADNPYVKYLPVRLTIDKKVLGYSMLRTTCVNINNVKFESLMIEDLIVSDASEDNFHLALSALVCYSATAELVLFVTLLQDDAVNRAIKRLLGPLARWHIKEGPELMVWEKDTEGSKWYFTSVLLMLFNTLQEGVNL